MTMTDPRRLLSLLADGVKHPAAELCLALGMDGADHKTLDALIGRLRSLDIGIDEGPDTGHVPTTGNGRCYRLASPLELLDAVLIRNAMDPDGQALLGDLDLQLQIDSTNARLRRSLDAATSKESSGTRPNGSACLSETQSAGRGRHGRSWASPPGGNIYLSLAWHYPVTVADLSGLSLALGVAATRAIADIGAPDIGLKWPNDLVWNDRKLGGILVELHSRQQRGHQVIAGIGINTHLTTSQAVGINQPWTDLTRILGHPPPRNRLAGRLLQRFIDTLSSFGKSAHEWQREFARRDVLASRAVTLTQPDGSVLHGIARGIDSQGALKIETNQGVGHYPIGEAGARPDPDPEPSPKPDPEQKEAP
jgi:BirA family biotin operon repressor/biotin-[acetyl-CoA-carboxylase] ligase